MTCRPMSQCAGAGSHSVLNQYSAKETPTVERRIRTSQLAPLHERITVRHELGPTRRNETQPYAIIRSMHACELDRGRLIKYALARRFVMRNSSKIHGARSISRQRTTPWTALDHAGDGPPLKVIELARLTRRLAVGCGHLIVHDLGQQRDHHADQYR